MKQLCSCFLVILLGIASAHHLIKHLDNGPTVSQMCDSLHEVPHFNVTIGGHDNSSGEANVGANTSGETRQWNARTWFQMKHVFSEPTESACSVVPEPFEIPDIKLSVLTKLEATNGRVFGLQQNCKKRPFIPKIFWKGRESFIRHEVDLSGLHVQYHVVTKGVERTFNWTMVQGSRAKMNLLLVEKKFPCPLTVDYIDLKLHFAGKDGEKKCTGECNNVLHMLQCHLFHYLNQTVATLPYNLVIKRTLCPDPHDETEPFKPDYLGAFKPVIKL